MELVGEGLEDHLSAVFVCFWWQCLEEGESKQISKTPKP